MPSVRFIYNNIFFYKYSHAFLLFITGSTSMFTSIFQDWYFLSPLNLFQRYPFSSQSTPPHSRKLPTVTYVPPFQCIVAWPVSAKNTQLYTTFEVKQYVYYLLLFSTERFFSKYQSSCRYDWHCGCWGCSWSLSWLSCLIV